MTNNKTMWMVRAGEGAYLVDEFLNKQFIAIGWNRLGDLTQIKDLEGLKARLQEAYPEYKTGQINNFAGQIYRFRCEFSKGHQVITYNPNARTYWIGEIISDYEFSPAESEFHHIRRVKWINSISRDLLSTVAKNSLGAIQTIFKISDTLYQELHNPNQAPVSPITAEKPEENLVETLDTIKEDIEARAYEFIKDKVLALDWEQMQELVAGILRGMGYKTLISPKGSDRGKDIIASPDGLGLENPKIIVEVKHRTGTMGAQEIRSFLGGLRASDKGLYVSTGGFTKDAKYEAERANIPLTLVDLGFMVRLIIQHYDNFHADTMALIPLKKIYWPV